MTKSGVLCLIFMLLFLTQERKNMRILFKNSQLSLRQNGVIYLSHASFHVHGIFCILIKLTHSNSLWIHK